MIRLSRTVAAAPEAAWDAFLLPRHVSKWFTTKAKAKLVVGGRYENADGDRGEYLVLDRPRRVRFTWDNPGHCPGTVVSVSFTPKDDGRTLVRLTHRGLETEKDRAEMREGWSWALDSFRSWLETGKPITFEEWKK